MPTHSSRRGHTAVALAAALTAAGAHAVGFDLGESDWSLRFDNTIKAGAMARTRCPRAPRHDMRRHR